MDIEKYISSGILESYALGDLGEDERLEVEKMLTRYPQIRAELVLIEETLESIAFHTAVAPKNDLKKAILQKALPEQEMPEKAERTLGIPEKKPFKYLLAAAVSFAVISAFAAAFFWNKWQDAENRLRRLALENTTLAQQFRQVNQRLQDAGEELAIYSGEHYQRIDLLGLPTAPEANAVVFWNEETGEVFLNPAKLPAIPADKQYQLWAIVNGQPVDMGVISEEKNGGLLKMKETVNAAAFAITLEPLGGSENPTMDQMYVMGEAG